MREKCEREISTTTNLSLVHLQMEVVVACRLQPGETWVGEMVLRSFEQEHLWPAEAARWEETDPMRPPEDDKDSSVPMA